LQLHQLFDGVAQFEGARLNKPPAAIWSFLRPREHSTIDLDHPRFSEQGSVSVESLVAGKLDGGRSCLAVNTWTVEFSDHSLCRAWQRSRVDFEKTVYAAHQAALEASEQQVRERKQQLLLPAPGGGFLCWVAATRVPKRGHISLLLLAETWIAEDMYHLGQSPVGVAGAPMAQWLVPVPLATFAKTEDGKLELIRLDRKQVPIVRTKENGRLTPAAS
jgi:hypothetical protein